MLAFRNSSNRIRNFLRHTPRLGAYNITKYSAVLSDAGCWEECCSCKKIIKESLSLYDTYFNMDEPITEIEFAKEVYLSNINNEE